jgi:small subunit ribosomal protein S4
VGRYTGPRERLSRRAGVDLELKGERRAARKGGLERRPYPPGEHGRISGRRPSTYNRQLRATQAAKQYYGVRERQFRRYVREAQRTLDALTGDRLLQILELRLDNVLVRLGFATTRAQARQFVVHGHVEVNGRRCDIPSRRLAEGDVVAFRQSSSVTEAARRAYELVDRVPGWLLADHEALVGRVMREPHRDEIQTPVDEQLIVEYHSRV